MSNDTKNARVKINLAKRNPTIKRVKKVNFLSNFLRIFRTNFLAYLLCASLIHFASSAGRASDLGLSHIFHPPPSYS